jgi:hypothetical protein
VNTNVATYIQSGNVLFSAGRLDRRSLMRRIEAALGRLWDTARRSSYAPSSRLQPPIGDAHHLVSSEMRYPAGHKELTRERIVRAAARRFRSRGTEGAGIGDLMRDLRLTHGGFYRHFDSKERLFATSPLRPRRSVAGRHRRAGPPEDSRRRQAVFSLRRRTVGFFGFDRMMERAGIRVSAERIVSSSNPRLRYLIGRQAKTVSRLRRFPWTNLRTRSAADLLARLANGRC